MFNQIGQAKYDITVAGEIALVLLCGGEKDEGLDVSLYRRTVIIFLKAHRMWNNVLCQPSAGAIYHSVRVYRHVMYWKGTGDSMKSEEWGWHFRWKMSTNAD